VVQEPAPTSQLVLGDLVINLSTYGVSVNQRTVDLTYYEFELIRRLAEEPDKIIDYDTLCQAVWSSSGRREKRRLTVAVCRIRAKLAGLTAYGLETVRGRGYGLLRRRRESAYA